MIYKPQKNVFTSNFFRPHTQIMMKYVSCFTLEPCHYNGETLPWWDVIFSLWVNSTTKIKCYYLMWNSEMVSCLYQQGQHNDTHI